MKKLVKRFVEIGIRPALLKYLASDRYYRLNGIRIKVKQGVFHPQFFFSTRFLLSEVIKLELKGKTLLELGAGSGLISFTSARHGAIVTCTDISNVAVEGLHENAKALNLPVQIYKSDLFTTIPLQKFDYILVNPPYYPSVPQNDAEKAWYCGADFEYFKGFFDQVSVYMHKDTMLLMVLSEDCNLTRISELAQSFGFSLVHYQKRKILWEINYIFRISKTNE